MIEVPTPHPVDAHVGARIAERRRAIRMTQDQLGRKLGIAFQQIQKYERAQNRISASKLYEISVLLDVPIDYFFAGLAGPAEKNETAGPNGLPADQVTQDAKELARRFDSLTDPRAREQVLSLVSLLADRP